MTDKALRMAACEVNQILRYTDEFDVNRIPLGLRLFLKDVEDKNYIPDINPEISLYDHHLMQETKDILGMIYFYYWSDEAEANQIPNTVKDNAKNVNDEIFSRYSSDEYREVVGDNRNKTTIVEQSLTSTAKEPWYKRFFGWLKNKKF